MRDDAYQAAVRYILRRPHTEYELIVKLKRKGYHMDEINSAIDNLKKEQHIDDAVLACDLVNWHNQRRPLGRFGLRQRLRKKGVKTEHIQAALEKNLPERLERKLLWDLATKKYAQLQKIYDRVHEQEHDRGQGQQTDMPLPVRDKLARFLIGRGFSNELIISVLEQIRHD